MTPPPVRTPASFARITVIAATICALVGCLPAASDPTGVTPLEGLWDVSGQSASAGGASFQGTWTVRSTSAAGFSGSYDVLESAASGGQRRLTGPVSGRMANATTTEFDVIVIGATRRHVATKQADTVKGSWFDVGQNGAVEASGTFRAVRR